LLLFSAKPCEMSTNPKIIAQHTSVSFWGMVFLLSL
jgi:hypothetical protein